MSDVPGDDTCSLSMPPKLQSWEDDLGETGPKINAQNGPQRAIPDGLFTERGPTTDLKHRAGTAASINHRKLKSAKASNKI